MPYKKRVGRILRKDYWAIFSEIQKDFSDSITSEILATSEAVKKQAHSETINCLSKIAMGMDYIGIVPENVTPRYFHSYFPDEDEIIDFMNLWEEKQEQVIKKTFWYPMEEVKLE